MRGQHKGENGKVLVIGGSGGYVGAPALAAMAALRSGCDIAAVAAPEKAAYAINAMSPNLITKKLDGTHLTTSHVHVLVEAAKEFDCVVIGPGLGKKKETMEAVRMLCRAIKKKKVLDADALYAKPSIKNCVVTPHAKEFKALFGKAGTKANAKNAAKGFVVLLKGKVDIITDGKRVAENRTGNDGMTVGGTGDVLAGLCAGLVAQGASLYKAAQDAALINGLAGDALLAEMGCGFLASDLLETIPYVKG